MRNTLISVAILLLSTPVQAGECLSVVFDEPVVSGVPITVAISVGSANNTCLASPPTCGFAENVMHGHTTWGDGQDSTWLSSGKPSRTGIESSWAALHEYSSPGRYVVITSFHQTYISGQIGCSDTGVFLRDTLVVDVAPNPELLADGWIGTFFDAQGSSCSETVYPGSVIYVIAGLQGLSANGIGAAEFRLRPSASGFSFGVMNSPGWIRIGDVFGDGVTLAASCDFTRGLNQVVLMKIVVLQVPTVSDVNLFVEKHRSPSNATYNDAKIILCDAPSFTAIDASRGNVALLNPSAEPENSCAATPTAVNHTAWSGVKELYRE